MEYNFNNTENYNDEYTSPHTNFMKYYNQYNNTLTLTLTITPKRNPYLKEQSYDPPRGFVCDKDLYH